MSVSSRWAAIGAAAVSVGVAIAAIGVAAAGVPAASTTSSVTSASVSSGAKGWDSAPHYEGSLRTQASKAELQCMKGNGFSFLMLYSNFTTDGEDWATVYANATGMGIQAVLVQGFEDPSLFADPSNGTTTGQADVAHAQKVKYPKGSQFFMDFEQNTTASESAEVQWANNWATQITNAGYVAAAYVGLPQKLTVSDLNSGTLPKIKVYWRSESTSAPQAPQGFVVSQDAASHTDCGYGNYKAAYEIDTAKTDSKGNVLVGSGGGSTTSPPTTASSTKTTTTSTAGISHADGVTVQKVAVGGGYTGPLDGIPGSNTWKGVQTVLTGYGYTGPIDGAPATNTYMALQRLAAAGGYTGPIDGSMGVNSWKGVQTVMSRYGYTGPIDGQPGTNTYMAMQRLAKLGGYTGPIDGALGTNSWKGIQRMLTGFGYSGPIDGAPGTNTYTALQRLAQDGGYTGPLDGAPGPNTYAALATLV